MNASERRRMAALPVALPVRPPVATSEGLSRAAQALARYGIRWRLITDADLLRAYQILRDQTGLHPADLWLAWQQGTQQREEEVSSESPAGRIAVSAHKETTR